MHQLLIFLIVFFNFLVSLLVSDSNLVAIVHHVYHPILSTVTEKQIYNNKSGRDLDMRDVILQLLFIKNELHGRRRSASMHFPLSQVTVWQLLISTGINSISSWAEPDLC